MLTSQAIEGFLLDCQARNLSPHTLNGYKAILSQLKDFLDNSPIEQVTTNDLRRFIIRNQDRHTYAIGNHPFNAETDKKLSPFSVHRYTRSIKTFFNWLVSEGILSSNPGSNVKYPKLPKKPIPVFTDSEIETLLSKAKEQHFRDYALCFFLLDSGLRKAEVVALKTNDVDLIGGLVTVQSGKGDKFRQVKVGNHCRKILWQYVTQYRKPAHDSITAFWLTLEGTELSYNALGIMLNRLGKKCGFRVFAHRFRHSFGTRLAKIVPNAFLISQAMGHEDLETSKNYVHFSQEDVTTISPMDYLLK